MADAVDVIAATLAETREVNGGELESVLTIYRPEGLALLVMASLKAAGFEITERTPAERDEVYEILGVLDEFRAWLGNLGVKGDPTYRRGVQAVIDHYDGPLQEAIIRAQMAPERRNKASNNDTPALTDASAESAESGRQLQDGSG